MEGLLPGPRESYRAPFSVALWLAVFLSPTAYFVLLLAWARFRLPTPPAAFVVALFCLVPLAALWVCGNMLWHTKRRAVGMVLTVLAMALQIGFLLFVIVSAVTVAISLP